MLFVKIDEQRGAKLLLMRQNECPANSCNQVKKKRFYWPQSQPCVVPALPTFRRQFEMLFARLTAENTVLLMDHVFEMQQCFFHLRLPRYHCLHKGYFSWTGTIHLLRFLLLQLLPAQ